MMTAFLSFEKQDAKSVRNFSRDLRERMRTGTGIIVEIKAVGALMDEHRAQFINYLNASGFQLGLLINFGGHPKLQWERLVMTEHETHKQ